MLYTCNCVTDGSTHKHRRVLAARLTGTPSHVKAQEVSTHGRDELQSLRLGIFESEDSSCPNLHNVQILKQAVSQQMCAFNYPLPFVLVHVKMTLLYVSHFHTCDSHNALGTCQFCRVICREVLYI